jgi:hypothetical protein
MKTKAPLVAVLLCGLTAVSNAFTLDFVGYEGSTLPPNPLVIPIPGYGDVVFEAVPGSSLVVNNAFQNDNGSAGPTLSFNSGEAVKITFAGLQPLDVDFEYSGVSVGEFFVATQDAMNSKAFLLTLNGTQTGAAGLQSISWNAVPEPTSALLGVLGGAVLVLRRRR